MSDFMPEPDLDTVADHALMVTQRLTDRELYPELVNLCRNHPAKAAQVLMCLAAWHDGADPETLAERAEAAARPEIDWRAVGWVVKERIRMAGLNRLERREVVLALSGQITDAEIGELIGMSRDAVLKVRERSSVAVAS